MLLLACGFLLKTYTAAFNNADTAPPHDRPKAGTTSKDFDPRLSLDLHSSSEHHVVALRKRQAWSSPAFKNAVNTGQAILSVIDGRGSQKPRPSFEKVSDLQDWGWTSTEMEREAIKHKLGNFAAVLKAKGVSIDAPTMCGVTLVHARETVHGSVKYPATGGTFDLILDPDQGLIIPSKSYSPAWYVQSKKGPAQTWPPNAPLPQLRNWADIAFLAWLDRTTHSTRKSIRYILNINALNPTTVDVVSEALKQSGVKKGVPPPWPGYVFTQVKPGPFDGNRAYAAVLGTPNVLGTGWLVAQRQEVMGKKRVGGITVFDSSGFESGNGGFQLSVLVEVTERKG